MRGTRRVSRRIGNCKSSRICLAGAVAALALACGGEKQTAQSAAAPAATPAAPSTTEEPDGLARLEALYEWDPVAGAARDLKSDTTACRSQVTAEGLPGVAEHIQCMRELGWKTLQPQS